MYRQLKKVSEYSEEEPQKNNSPVKLALFPIKMIAKLERTQSIAPQNMEQTQNPTMGATINNDSTTEPPPWNGQQPKPSSLVLCPRFCYC